MEKLFLSILSMNEIRGNLPMGALGKENRKRRNRPKKQRSVAALQAPANRVKVTNQLA